MVLRQKKDLSYKNLFLPSETLLFGGNRTKSNYINSNFGHNIYSIILLIL